MPIFMQMGLPGEDTRLKGPVKTPPHIDWFEVSSVQFAVSRHAVYPGAQPSGGARERGQSAIRELVITMPSDGSPLFYKASIDGRGFETVIIDFERDGQSHLVLKLKDVFVSSYSLSGGRDRPIAAIALSFTDIEQHYSPASARLDSDATANPVGDLLPIAVLRQLVNAFMGP
jgi:type VI protein secretion system component Hcp